MGKASAAAFALLSFLAAAGCGPTYRVHPAMDLPPGATRRLGCLEISMGVGRDYDLPEGSVLVQVELHNLCEEPTLVDLRALRMWTERMNGERHPLAPWDPRGEVEPLHMEPEATALERLRVDDAGVPGEVRAICFDPTHVNGPTRRLAGVVCYRFDHELSGREQRPSDAPADEEEEP